MDLFELWEHRATAFPGLAGNIRTVCSKGPLLREEENAAASSNRARNDAFGYLVAGRLLAAGVPVVAVDGIHTRGTICENVKVPWERVFVHDDTVLAREIYIKTLSHCFGNHQSNVRYWSKRRLLLGLCSKIAHATGADQTPGVRETLGKMSAVEGAIAGMVHGQINAYESWPDGYVCFNRRMMYAALEWCTQNYTMFIDQLRELSGGSVFQLPADISVLADPHLAEQFRTYFQTPQADAVSRMKLFKLAWDMVGSEFAGRHLWRVAPAAGTEVMSTIACALPLRRPCKECRMPDVVGFRAKMGVIIPSTNTVVESDFWDMRIPGVTFHTGRIYIAHPTLSSDAAMEALLAQVQTAIETAVRDVMTSQPDYLIMGMSAPTFWGGLEGGQRFAEKMRKLSGLPISMGSNACRVALEKYHAKKIAVLTPYQPIMREQIVKYFQDCGLQVVRYKDLCCPSATAIAEVTPAALRPVLQELNGPDVDAIVQCGTNLSMIRLAADAEGWLDKPVIAINTATLWHAYRVNGWLDHVYGFGSLLSQH